MTTVLSLSNDQEALLRAAICDPLTVYVEIPGSRGREAELAVSSGVAPPAGVYAALCRGSGDAKVAAFEVFPTPPFGGRGLCRRAIARFLDDSSPSGVVGFTLIGWIRPRGAHLSNDDVGAARRLCHALARSYLFDEGDL